MALDLTILGATAVQAVAKLVNFTLNTNIDPRWIAVTGNGSPFLAPVTVTVSAVTTPDASGNAPIYVNGETITYNRCGFQKSFVGLNLKVKLQGPFTIGSVVAAVQAQYGIVLEAADILQSFAQPVNPDAQGNVTLKPGLNSLRFFIDNSAFNLVIAIDQTTQTDLQKLIAMTQMADMSALNAANTPASHAYLETTPIIDRPT